MNKVHLIGNAHLDPAWLWNWQEGYAEVLTTFRSALDRMREYGDYVFTCAGAAYYSWVEKTDPAMFEEIRVRVKEGRWIIVGGWWIQPDCNLPCGESFARQALYSQRYFQSRFGITAQVGYNVDSFGHNAMLPQILRQSGMTGYVYMRPSPNPEYRPDAEPEKYYPFPDNAFLWEGPDGTRIPAYRIPMGYGSGGTDHAASKAQRVASLADEQDLPQMSFYGVGNHGGGPTAQNLTTLDALIKKDTKGRYAFSSPDAYFAQLPTEKLKILKDDLQNHASGCYTAVMKIKELNRKAEERLISAEKFTSMAQILGLHIQAPSLEKAWQSVLFNQFHDILGGCSIKSVYDSAFQALGGAIDAAEKAENEALQLIFWNVETLNEEIQPQGKFDFRIWDSSRGVPIIVFNPHSQEIEASVRVPVNNAKYATDHEGNSVAIQSVRAEFTANVGIGMSESMMCVKVPAMGYRVYRIYQEEKGDCQLVHSLAITETSLENDWTRLVLDPATGAILSLFDKKTGRELIGAPCRARVMDETHCDTWAHAVFRFDQEVGAFDQASISIVEEGNVRGALEVKTGFGKSLMQQKFVMYRDRPGVYVEHYVLWNEQHRMLKLCFPVNLTDAVPTIAIPYGFQDRRADGREYPMQNWVALRSQGRGLGIATDSRTAYDATGNELRITALHSPIYADHLSNREPGYFFTDQGEHFFTLYLGAVGEDTQPLQQAADLLVSPLRVLLSGDHHGCLPEVDSVLSFDRANVSATVLKTAEDGSGTWILRCHETCGEETTVRVSLGSISFDAHFGPQQIRTFRIHENQVSETNLTELD